MPSTWRAPKPSYLIHPSVRQVPDGVFSTARTPIRTTTRRSRVSIAQAGTERRATETETSESDQAETPTRTPNVSEEDLKRQYEARKKAVLDPGPPHLRLEIWYTPLANAYERQLAIKKLSPLLPLLPASLSNIAKEQAKMLADERSASPLNTAGSKKKRYTRFTPVAQPSKHDIPID